LDYAEPLCLSFGGEPLEQLMEQQVLEVVTPATVELSLRAAADYQRQRAELDRHWQLRLERAHQDVARASRQYNAVEPENRLVARTLERRWEEALLAGRALEEEYDRSQREQPVQLGAAERAQIEALAQDLPALWRSPRTGVEERRQVIRLLVQQVVVWPSASSQELKVHVHWSGGTVTEHRVTRTVKTWEQVADIQAVWERVQTRAAQGWTSRRTAAELNAAGYRTPRGLPFTAESVRQLRGRFSARAPRLTAPNRRRGSHRGAKKSAAS
jgi:hypothetical protein